jgi:hypothetical protein
LPAPLLLPDDPEPPPELASAPPPEELLPAPAPLLPPLEEPAVPPELDEPAPPEELLELGPPCGSGADVPHAAARLRRASPARDGRRKAMVIPRTDEALVDETEAAQ